MVDLIQSAFENLLQKELTLSATQISQASTSHNYIRNLLANKNDNDYLFPKLIDGDFLSGSYARGTKIYPLDDIDVMIVMDGAGLSAISEGAVLDAYVRGSGDADNPVLQHLGPDRLLGSRKILDLFKNTLQKSHPNSEIRKNGQAVNVWLDSFNMGIDIVPCFHILPRNGSQEHYYIPMGNNSDFWMTTNPKIDEKISDNLHAIHNRMFKDVVRLMKYWNRVSNQNRLRSYHLETAIWHSFDTYQGIIQSYDDALIHIFATLPNIINNPCPDKTGLGSPVDSYLNDSDRQASVEKLSESFWILNAAYSQSDTKARLLAWGKIFGDKFIY